MDNVLLMAFILFPSAPGGLGEGFPQERDNGLCKALNMFSMSNKTSIAHFFDKQKIFQAELVQIFSS